LAPEIAESHAPAKQGGLTLRERSRHVEADQIRAALAAHGDDRDAVCNALGISKTTLWRKLNAAR
jgi:propionate catabolism operon transcriptional regulator